MSQIVSLHIVKPPKEQTVPLEAFVFYTWVCAIKTIPRNSLNQVSNYLIWRTSGTQG